MIPKHMDQFLRERLPERAWRNRLIQDNGMAFMEFGPLDVEHLARLDIVADSLGPRLVACMWDESSELEVGGYLVVDNLAMGRPSMGGIRKLPSITPAAVHNLARGMTLKSAAASLPFGGGKSGIVSLDQQKPEDHEKVVRRFAHLLSRYRDIYRPGPDVGTNDSDMKTIAIENGLDNALSKPAEMGGVRIDQLGAAAGGVVIALETLLQEMPRLKALPQFADLSLPTDKDFTVLIQGFGAVGAHAGRILAERLPNARVIGVSDELGYLFDLRGLDIHALFELWKERGLVTQPYYQDRLIEHIRERPRTKFSNAPNDLLRESAFCLIPAAPIANYLDVTPETDPCMTVDRMGRWQVIVEGANTYSPDPVRLTARARMERQVYRSSGVLIATDYLVNSGGVIYGAQELLIKTPDNLRLPVTMLGDAEAVAGWLEEHAADFEEIAERRRVAGREYREQVIRQNMVELVDLLASDADLLPMEAAERISVRRIASRESDRTAVDIMEPIPTIMQNRSVQQAAATLVESGTNILAVVGAKGDLKGVVTSWDITKAAAGGGFDQVRVEEIMSREVVSASPDERMLELVRKLEFHNFSAMPVVDQGAVLGLVSSDLLATRALLRLLQAETG